jgi:hypothetical protein
LHWTTPSPVARDSGVDQQISETFAKRVILRFTPFATVSWDHGKLGGKY